MSSEPTPQPEKSIATQQAELADEILGYLGLHRSELDAEELHNIRAAIAHYTVTVCEK